MLFLFFHMIMMYIMYITDTNIALHLAYLIQSAKFKTY